MRPGHDETPSDLVRDLREGTYTTPGVGQTLHNARLIEAIRRAAERGERQKITSLQETDLRKKPICFDDCSITDQTAQSLSVSPLVFPDFETDAAPSSMPLARHIVVGNCTGFNSKLSDHCIPKKRDSRNGPCLEFFRTLLLQQMFRSTFLAPSHYAGKWVIPDEDQHYDLAAVNALGYAYATTPDSPEKEAKLLEVMECFHGYMRQATEFLEEMEIAVPAKEYLESLVRLALDAQQLFFAAALFHPEQRRSCAIRCRSDNWVLCYRLKYRTNIEDWRTGRFDS